MEAYEINRLPNAKRVFLVGAEPMILSTYDRNQLWLPFMIGAIFTADVVEPVRIAADHNKRNAGRDRRHTHVPNEAPHYYRKPYLYEKGVPQYVLPFGEFKRLSNSQFKDFADAGYPTWDRNPETAMPYRIHIRDRPFDPAQWCEENFDGRFHCSTRVITVEREMDAIRAKLLFS
jgi:hypothetical protein